MENLSTKIEKIISVQKLLISCPFGLALDNCPARELRKLSLTARLDKANEMNEEQIDSIIICHKICAGSRGRKTEVSAE